jgi:hypothetical protein
VGKRSRDAEDVTDGNFSGDLRQGKQEDGPRTMERDSGGVQGFEYFGVDTRDEEENK